MGDGGEARMERKGVKEGEAGIWGLRAGGENGRIRAFLLPEYNTMSFLHCQPLPIYFVFVLAEALKVACGSVPMAVFSTVAS